MLNITLKNKQKLTAFVKKSPTLLFKIQVVGSDKIQNLKIRFVFERYILKTGSLRNTINNFLVTIKSED